MKKSEIAAQLEYLEEKSKNLSDSQDPQEDTLIKLGEHVIELPWQEAPQVRHHIIGAINTAITRLKGEMHSALYPKDYPNQV